MSSEDHHERSPVDARAMGPTATVIGRRQRENALEMGPRKKA